MKNVLVTGACGGMGLATVKALLREGCRVFALDKTACELDGEIVPIEIDLTKEDSIISAVNTMRAYTDSLDAIIHFAGIYMLDSLVEMDTADFERIFAVNLHGVFLVNKYFLPFLNRGGKILITTSELASLDPLPFTGIYAVTKAALDKYAYSLAMELQLLGISVSVLRAGAVNTDMLGASTRALDKFCENTRLYSCNAKRFKDIVNRVEARCVPTSKIAARVVKILKKRKPAFAYKINRNPLLLLLNMLPCRMQLRIIKSILK